MLPFEVTQFPLSSAVEATVPENLAPFSSSYEGGEIKSSMGTDLDIYIQFYIVY